MAENVGLSIGSSNVDKRVNAQFLCDKEIIHSHQFAINNPESVLPVNEDF